MTDDFNRQVLHIEVDYWLRSSRVVWMLNHLIKSRDKPEKIKIVNVPGFISQLLRNGIYSAPKAHAECFVERLNETYHDNVLT